MTGIAPRVVTVTSDPKLAETVAEAARRAGREPLTWLPEEAAGIPRIPPDLLVLDLELPHALRLAAALRKRFEPAEVPIVGVMQFLSQPERQPFHDAGFATLVARPVSVERIEEVLSAFAMVRPRVLLVDDEAANLNVMRTRLQIAGFDVVTTSDPTGALALARRYDPDVIVSDVLMPDLDGFGLTLAVRRDPDLAITPVLLLTAHYDRPEDHELALQVGASAFFQRGGTLDGLVDEIWTQVRRGRRPTAVPDREAVMERLVERLRWRVDRLLAQVLAAERRTVLADAALEILRRTATTIAGPGDLSLVYPALLSDLAASSALSLVLLYEGGPGELRFRAGAGATFIQVKGCPEAEVCEAILDGYGDEVVFIPGTVIDVDLVVEFLTQSHVGHTLLCPLILHGRRIGVLVLGSDERDLSGPQWTVFASTVSSQLALAFALARRGA